MENEKRLFDANAKMIDKYFNKRLIDAHELYYRMCKVADEYDNDHVFIDVIVDEIANAPTVDAVEVVHGRWIERKEIFYESEGEVDAIGCSVCGKSQRKYHRTNYCPNCGAKMDGGETNVQITD